MRTLRPLIAALLLAVASLAPADTQEPPTIDELQHDTEALIDKLGDYSAEQRDKATAAASETLDKLDARIQELRERLADNWDEMSEDSREALNDKLKALEQQRSTVADWYDRLKDSSASAWDSVKRGFSRAYEDLSETWEETEKQMQQERQTRKRDQSI
ncbi:hypothetical protein QQM79_05270 [Marinobacteraceae bacterium S3BR75-40.1]